IDLMYLQRLYRTVPIEDSVGAMADMVRDGKVRTIGLSEMGAATLHRAHAVHPVAAMQTEYSLWTRNPEIAVLEACKALGAAFVAFSPLARKFLTGTLDNPQALPPEDLRHTMPRFSAENYPENQKLLPAFRAEAQALGCTMGQLALAWVLAQGDHVTPIPGTTSPDHARENMGAAQVRIPADVLARLDALINQSTVKGPRYSAKVQADVDTEEFTPDPTAATATANNP
ncbi:MAG: aldo/keto reductase, partial [Rhodobacterales bacterium]|nr:aldo/keto reductase [Rhodobacterales bacterium]